MKTDTLIVKSYAILFILFALPAFFMPASFASLLRYSIDEPGATMEFIAAYGGLILGIGIFLGLMAKEHARIGLLAILCSMGSLFIARLEGFFFDEGTTSIQVTFLVLELLTVLIVGSRLRKPASAVLSAA